MRIKRSLMLLMTLAASSLLLLIMSSKAEIRATRSLHNIGIGGEGNLMMERTSYSRWELLTGLLMRPAL
ncbi:MAG: hypothetical protein Q7T76_06800 [Ferruginibacter sp.]|nr:hypothetical protein [Ferruginibacter sp.]